MIRQFELESNQAEQLAHIPPKHRTMFHRFVFNIQKQGKAWQKSVEETGFTIRLREQWNKIIYSIIPVSENYPGSW